MEKRRRPPQTLTAEQFEAFRARLDEKGNEPPPQPETYKMGEIVRGLYPELKKLRENCYSLKVLVCMFAEGGVVITTNALATYLKKLELPRKRPQIKAYGKGMVAAPTIELRPGHFQMKPDRPL